MPNSRIRNDARISINKLGEYLVAKPSRRQTIIRDQKRPKDFVVARYTDAERAIQDYITDGSPDTVQLKRAIRSLKLSECETKWQQDTADLCAKALFAFMSIADEVSTNGFTPIKGDDSPEKMLISDVKISVRPEILLRDQDDLSVVGGIKLYIVKNNPLTDEAGSFVSTLLYRYIAEVISSEAAVHNKNCFVVDVFAGKVFQAPNTYKRNMNNIAAACAEISARWRSL